MTLPIYSPCGGIVIDLLVKEGEMVYRDSDLLVIEVMKMQNVVKTTVSGKVSSLKVKEGDVLELGQLLVSIEASPSDQAQQTPKIKPEFLAPDSLAALNERKWFLYDENRPEAVKSRKSKSRNTARENIALLSEKDTFKEYGSLVVAAQRTRRTLPDLIQNTPADGLITGTAEVNLGKVSGSTKTVIIAYDYTVLAGTQGMFNHAKLDRIIQVAEKDKAPIILLAEGGGGRPGDIDVQTVAGLHIMSFYNYARLKSLVPRIAVISGYCFAGNAALAGCSDILIGTADLSLGMGGPAMIEGGGLGVFHPAEIGTSTMHATIGTLDLEVKDETEAMAMARKVLSYFQGNSTNFSLTDQGLLNSAIPENRKRSFNLRFIISTLADEGSFTEFKALYARGMITGFIRIAGHPLGIIANNSEFDAGAITAQNANKAAKFLNLCNDFNIPIVSLIDTPGIMVGPDAEKEGTVMSASALFVAGAKLKVPVYAIVLRRAYGLGAMAMAGGSFHSTDFIVSWPSGEFGAMGIEGAVKLGFRKELEAITNLEEQNSYFEQMVEQAYERGKAINMASFFEIDDVIAPSDTRNWILSRF